MKSKQLLNILHFVGGFGSDLLFLTTFLKKEKQEYA